MQEQQEVFDKIAKHWVDLKIRPRGRMGYESINHEAVGRMGYSNS